MDQGKLQEVVTPYQTFKNNPYDKFMLNLLCTQAKLENDNKASTLKNHYNLRRKEAYFRAKQDPDIGIIMKSPKD